METNTDERSLTALVNDLTQQVGELVRQELQLARTEMASQAGRVGGGVKAMVIGTAFAYAGVTLMLLAAVAGLALVVPLWLAALFVGVVAANIGSMLLLRGRNALRMEHLMPQRTLRSLGRRVQVGSAETRRVA
jgi:putative superfamily III holin-X